MSDDKRDVLEVLRYELLQVNGPVAPWEPEQNNIGGLRRRVKNAIEDWSDEQNAEAIEQADTGHQDYRNNQLREVGAHIAQQPNKLSH